MSSRAYMSIFHEIEWEWCHCIFAFLNIVIVYVPGIWIEDSILNKCSISNWILDYPLNLIILIPNFRVAATLDIKQSILPPTKFIISKIFPIFINKFKDIHIEILKTKE